MKIDINYLRDIDSPPMESQLVSAERIINQFQDKVEACEYLGNLAIVVYLKDIDVWIWKTKISINFKNNNGENIHTDFESIESAIQYI